MGGKGKKPEISDHVVTVRRRLHQALSLGMKVSKSKVKRWQSTDTDTQSHALKSMNAFLSCISFTLLRHPLIQVLYDEGTKMPDSQNLAIIICEHD
ncbi:BTB/POZ domain [Musa troglodytarum]|nr:BTB/POZ domain [Musa troglodytarum]